MARLGWFIRLPADTPVRQECLGMWLRLVVWLGYLVFKRKFPELYETKKDLFNLRRQLETGFWMKVLYTTRIATNRHWIEQPERGVDLNVRTDVKKKNCYVVVGRDYEQSITQINNTWLDLDPLPNFPDRPQDKMDHSDILATGRSDVHCKMKETLLIRDLQPALSENIGSE